MLAGLLQPEHLYLLIARVEVEIVKMGAATLVLTESLRELIPRQRGSQLSQLEVPIADRPHHGEGNEPKPAYQSGNRERHRGAAQRRSMPLFEER